MPSCSGPPSARHGRLPPPELPGWRFGGGGTFLFTSLSRESGARAILEEEGGGERRGKRRRREGAAGAAAGVAVGAAAAAGTAAGTAAGGGGSSGCAPLTAGSPGAGGLGEGLRARGAPRPGRAPRSRLAAVPGGRFHPGAAPRATEAVAGGPRRVREPRDRRPSREGGGRPAASGPSPSPASAASRGRVAPGWPGAGGGGGLGRPCPLPPRRRFVPFLPTARFGGARRRRRGGDRRTSAAERRRRRRPLGARGLGGRDVAGAAAGDRPGSCRAVGVPGGRRRRRRALRGGERQGAAGQPGQEERAGRRRARRAQRVGAGCPGAGRGLPGPAGGGGAPGLWGRLGPGGVGHRPQHPRGAEPLRPAGCAASRAGEPLRSGAAEAAAGRGAGGTLRARAFLPRPPSRFAGSGAARRPARSSPRPSAPTAAFRLLPARGPVARRAPLICCYSRPEERRGAGTARGRAVWCLVRGSLRSLEPESAVRHCGTRVARRS